MIPSDIAGLAAFNLWQSQEAAEAHSLETSLRLSSHSLSPRAVSAWEALAIRLLWPALLRPTSYRSSSSSSSSSSCCCLLSPVPFSSEILPSSSHVRGRLEVLQGRYDPIDVVGRDGNFILGFGYVGDIPATFNAGRGPLWRAIKVAKARYRMQQQQQQRQKQQQQQQQQQQQLQQEHPFMKEDPSEHNAETFASICVDNERSKLPQTTPITTTPPFPCLVLPFTASRVEAKSPFLLLLQPYSQCSLLLRV